MTVLVQTDNDPALAEKIANELSDVIMKGRRELVKKTFTAEEAIRQALNEPGGPVVIADVADNPGAGSPGDGTCLLRKMMELGVKNAALALIPDEETVERAVKAGVGARVRVSLGGKGLNEPPFEAEGTVKTISDGVYVNKGPMKRGLVNHIGRTVTIDFNGIEVIVSERRIQPWDPEIFWRMGIEPKDKKILAVKSSMHFRAAFTELATRIIDAECPGLCPSDARSLPIKSVRRPIFPLDEPCK
jgi:microcystin degradation protein MlrC